MKKENPSPNFIEMEHEMLSFWEKEKCFDKLVEQNKDGERFRFLDGPITANNAMGIHHAWGRTLKDMYIKYNSMKGKSCQFQNGFDAQGLWVEVEVEKELGVKTKREIAEYGLDKFTEKCIARVDKFSKIITEQSKRLGQWMDWENSYYTNSDQNITAIWHFLKVCHEKGWLKKSHRPMPWCPRCGTSLSEHEMSGSYKEVEHTTIFSKLPILNTDDSIILWTTTPWTLTANVALAVNPDIEYVRVTVKSDKRKLIVGKNALGKLLKGDIESVSDPFKGAELIGKTYETCFPELPAQNFEHKIVAWEEVDEAEGTGVVHIAPGCGAEDFELGKTLGLPMISPIDEEAKILPNFGKFSGQTTVEVKDDVISTLNESAKLYKTEQYVHSYPYCWRCKTDVVFKLVDEWQIKTEEIRPMLIAASNTVKYEPEFAGKRMLDWLNNMSDWTISRKRFYGLPLPFYECKHCGHLTVVGSKEELLELSEHHSLEGVPNLHRPYIDHVKIRCPICGELVERVPEVGDCWLDAGITPFSTKKYFEDPEYFKKNFPSELVVEMKEQIRLWFYSQLFMSVALTGKAPYENVVAYSSVVNEEGGKFSKTGFMIRFDEAAEKIGADPIRYLFVSAPVGSDVRFGYNLTDESRRKLIAFWNVYYFFNLYASLDRPDVAHFKPDFAALSLSDRWLLNRVNVYLDAAKKAMETYRTANLIKEFESLTDDVSNWYIRINRKRFWKSQDKKDQMNAYWCLYYTIKKVVGTLAPIIPFLTEHIWQNMVRELEPEESLSIHMSRYPERFDIADDAELLKSTDAARAVIQIAQRIRNEAQRKVKQPLRAMYLKTSAEDEKLVTPWLETVKEELNIKEAKFAEDESLFFDPYFSVNFRVAGRVLKGEAQKLKSVVDAMSKEEYRAMDKMFQNGSVEIAGFGTLGADVFERHLREKEGFVVAQENGKTVALDIELDAELLEEGMIRELIRQIQVMRKDADFAVDKRVSMQIVTDASNNELIRKYMDKIASDVLAESVVDNLVAAATEKTIEVGGGVVTVKLK